jgi:hypothetical protein
MEEVRLEAYQDSMFEAYAEFALRQFGRGAYQATRRYLGWLYDDNPVGRPDGKRQDFIVCRQGEQVVGCIHKMRLRWRVKDEALEIPVLHNWMVAPEHRHGMGSLLLTAAFRGEAHALIPASEGELVDMYRRLRCEEVPLSSYRRFLSPVRGGIRYLIAQGGKNHLFGPFRYQEVAREVTRRKDSEVGVAVEPSPQTIEILAAAANRPGGDGAVRPDWTGGSFHWRFFHPRGPRHLLLQHVDDPGSFLILGAGDHRGLVVGRIIEVVCPDFDRFRALVEKAQEVLRALGAHVMLVYSADDWLNEMLARYGLRPLGDTHPAFFFHASSRARFGTVALHGSAIDYGFEALLS